MTNKTIYSPQILWKNFDSLLPLEEETVSETVEDKTTFRDMYFKGRQTGEGRVRIFATYAYTGTTSKRALKGAILIIPDMSESIDRDLMKYYLKQGYNVLMVDYRGKYEGAEHYTEYTADVEYANYATSGRALDYADNTAIETSWYEWVAVMKYAVSFLRSQPDVRNVGVFGIKNGADVGWMLCGTETRIDCFAAAFAAGWRAYKGVFKYAEKDIAMDEERIRFLAGVEAQAYAQHVKCPVFFATATNSSEFDVDRSVDTLSRFFTPSEGGNYQMEQYYFEPKNGNSAERDNQAVRYNNYAPGLNDALDKRSQIDVDLFFAKYLLAYKIVFPEEPKITLDLDGKNVTATLEIDFSDQKRPKKVDVYFSEGGINPAFREWNRMREKKGNSEVVREFTYKMNGNSRLIHAFAVVEYRNQITLSSKIITKKIEPIPSRYNKLIYSSTDKNCSFSVYNVKNYSQFGIFFNDSDCVMSKEVGNGISGITSKYGLICYKVNSSCYNLSDLSFLKMDVFCKEDTALKLILMLADDSGVSADYETVVYVNGADVWQNIMLKCAEFKQKSGLPIKDYSHTAALRIEADTSCVVNNILLI